MSGSQELGRIEETAYLNAENVERYRWVMHYFFTQHRQMNMLLYRDDVLTYVQEKFDGSYGEREVDQDLDQLYQWGNLSRRQEMGEPKSIEEYKNRRYRYQITETSIQIEEMLERLGTVSGNSQGRLDKNVFQELLDGLQELVQSDLFDEEETYKLWERIVRLFSDIQRNTSNYMGYLANEAVVNYMQTEKFLIYKDQFVQYLRDFIVTVQGLHYQIEHQLQLVSQEKLKLVFESMLARERRIPRIDDFQLDQERIKSELFGSFQTMKRWFIDEGDKTSEFSTLIRLTEQMIRRMTGLIQQLSSQFKQYQSRRKDYLQLAHWFDEVASCDEAANRFASIFGSLTWKHYYGVEPIEGTKNESIWNLSPEVLQLDSRSRKSLLSQRTITYTVDRELKEQQRVEIAEKKNELQTKIAQFITDGEIRLMDDLMVPSEIRVVFLQWISSSLAKDVQVFEEERLVSTNLGYQVGIMIQPEKRITIRSEDGLLEMPQVTMKIKETINDE
ncbi:TIGR02677 family protein [Enterococcus raffinosus]|uniref:TIGR02677 family protein n=1 Tax=Enterococcus raffinosus TaxID=71452 RepID=UPI001C11787F|nr:TIGR02677 family protein [Enterococcus raffinosus]MBU5360880.1 TIGR02677 family protein [Enterococcus raffinosus]